MMPRSVSSVGSAHELRLPSALGGGLVKGFEVGDRIVAAVPWRGCINREQFGLRWPRVGAMGEGRELYVR